MKNIKWAKAHLKKENATKAGVCFEDWYGNNEAYIQAKEGAAKHGYTENQKNVIQNRVVLAKNVQEHMLRTYIRYIQHTLVREDALKHKRIKGSPTGKKGRQIIRPEQMGHGVQTNGDYEYCLGCGRTSKAKYDKSAKRVFWGREFCKPVKRLERYRKRRHDLIFDEWWKCNKCQAKGPELNKRDCINPQRNHTEGDDDDDDDEYRHKKEGRRRCGFGARQWKF
eukprot:8253309-Heterocapsa_arctica.AAC.1